MARLKKERSLFLESDFSNGSLRVFACPSGEDDQASSRFVVLARRG
jgi:hypothetical protein